MSASNSSGEGAQSNSASGTTAVPNTTITSQPINPSNLNSASFSFTSTETGSTFQCQLDGGGYTSCISPKSYTGLTDGSHIFDVRATDAAGNTDPSPASYTWTVDTTAPNTSITAQPTNPSNLNSANFSFTSTETGSTFQCQLDGGGYTTCVSPKSYTGLTDGSHTFDVRATDGAGNTDPSPASYTWTVDTTAPDLTVLSFTSPSSSNPGATLSYGYYVTVKNNGTASASASDGNFAVALYLSTDTVWNSGVDTLLIGGRSTVSTPMAAAATAAVPIGGMGIPSGTVTGSYYLLAVVDELNEVTNESNEGNNVASNTITISSPAPDLIVLSVDGPTSATPGGTIAITDTVKNQGSASAGPFYVYFYLSTDTTITTSDTQLGSRYLASGLSAGASSSSTTNVTVPTSAATGNYYIGAIVDKDNTISESNETNNTGYDSTPITVLSVNMSYARSGHCAVAYSGKIYVVGGSGSAGAVSTVEVLDTATGTWSVLTTSNAPAGPVACVEYGGYIYTFQNTTVKRLLVSTPSSTWSTVTSSLTFNIGNGDLGAVIVGSKAYLAKSYDSNLYYYDISNGSNGVQPASIPSQRTIGFGMAGIGNTVYLFGGGGSGSNMLMGYNTSTETWIPSVGSYAFYATRAVAYNGFIYSAGGGGGYLTNYGDKPIYKILFDGNRSQIGSLSVERANVGAVVIGNTLYVIGGTLADGTKSNSHEVITIP